jgi:hypothetical protein
MSVEGRRTLASGRALASCRFGGAGTFKLFRASLSTTFFKGFPFSQENLVYFSLRANFVTPFSHGIFNFSREIRSFSLKKIGIP